MVLTVTDPFTWADSGSAILNTWQQGSRNIEVQIWHVSWVTPGSDTGGFCSHAIGQNSDSWLHLPVKDDGKFSPACALEDGGEGNRIGG